MDAPTLLSDLPPLPISRIALVGTGVIGSGWAAIFSARGCKVTVFVRSIESEKKFRGIFLLAWRKLVARGLAENVPEHSLQGRIKCVYNLAECVANAEYVQESVIEEMSLKQSIIKAIDEHAPAHVMIGTSSSFIPLSAVRARASRHPERIATAHPTVPQWDNFIEILGSTPEHSRRLARFFSKVGMDPIVLHKEMHGHVHNFILEVLVSASVTLVKAGVCNVAEIDKAIVHLARIIIACNGVSNALVGVVGNGVEGGFVDLSTDVWLGLPTAVGAQLSTWLFPAWLASLCVTFLTAMARLYTGSPFLKSLVRPIVAWSTSEFQEEWLKGEQTPTATRAETFERAGLKRMNSVTRVRS